MVASHAFNLPRQQAKCNRLWARISGTKRCGIRENGKKNCWNEIRVEFNFVLRMSANAAAFVLVLLSSGNSVGLRSEMKATWKKNFHISSRNISVTWMYCTCTKIEWLGFAQRFRWRIVKVPLTTATFGLKLDDGILGFRVHRFHLFDLY